MIKIKIDKNKLNEPVFKLWFKELNEKEERFLKRALIESKEIQGSYKYEIPIKFLLPIINNIGKENIKIDRHSKLSFLEFSDDFDEKYFSFALVNATYSILISSDKVSSRILFFIASLAKVEYEFLVSKLT